MWGRRPISHRNIHADLSISAKKRNPEGGHHAFCCRKGGGADRIGEPPGKHIRQQLCPAHPLNNLVDVAKERKKPLPAPKSRHTSPHINEQQTHRIACVNGCEHSLLEPLEAQPSRDPTLQKSANTEKTTGPTAFLFSMAHSLLRPHVHLNTIYFALPPNPLLVIELDAFGPQFIDSLFSLFIATVLPLLIPHVKHSPDFQRKVFIIIRAVCPGIILQTCRHSVHRYYACNQAHSHSLALSQLHTHTR